MHILLPLLIVAISTDAPIAVRYPEAIEVFHCDFSRQWDENYDGWPHLWNRRQGRGFPRYLEITIDEEEASPAGKHCLRMKLNGGGAVVYSPLIDVDSLHGYVVEAWLKTKGLQHDRAFLVITFFDKNQRFLERYTSEEIGDSAGWKKIRLGPITTKHAEVQSAIIGLHLEPGKRADLKGSAWFDDIWLGQLPRLTLSANSPHHLYKEGDVVQITCEASGIAQANPPITFLLEDAFGNVFTEVQRTLSSPTAERASSQLRSSFSSGVSTLSGSILWKPPVPGPGFYIVRANMKGNEGQVYRRKLSLAVLRRQTTMSDGEFGWSLPEGNHPLPLADLGSLIAQMGIHWVKFPLWISEAADSKTKEDLLAFVERLSIQGIEFIGLLNHPPAKLRKQLGAPTSPTASEIFTLPTEIWYPTLEPVMMQMAIRVRWWQLGDDSDRSYVGQKNLFTQLARVKEALDRIGQDVRLGVAWDWLEQLPEVPSETTDNSKKLPLRFLAFSANPPLTHSKLAVHLKATSNHPVFKRFVMLEPLPQSDYPLEVRAVDLVRRMITAKIEGAEGIFFSNPFDSQRGLLNDDGTPSELLLPWRTTAMALSGSRFLGSIQFPQGSENRVFSRGGETILVVWNDKPVQEIIYLGEDVRQIDLWGRTVHLLRKQHRHVVNVGSLPTFLIGVHDAITQWRMNCSFGKTKIPSVTGHSYGNLCKFSNQFLRGATGQVKLVLPESWIVKPDGLSFRLVENEKKQLPFQVTLPMSADSGPHRVRVDFDVQTDKHYQFSVYRMLQVGLGDVLIEYSTRLNDLGELEVEQRFINGSSSPVSFRCRLSAPGRRARKTQVINLASGHNTQTYRLPRGKELLGKTLWLQAIELRSEEPRGLNYRFEARQ